jgi:hypothetical protein
VKDFQSIRKTTFAVVQGAEKLVPPKSAGKKICSKCRPWFPQRDAGQPGRDLVEKYRFAQAGSRGQISRRQKRKNSLILASQFFWPLDMGEISQEFAADFFTQSAWGVWGAKRAEGSSYLLTRRSV